MVATSKQLQFLYRRYGESIWHNIRFKEFPSFNLNIENKLFQFNFSSYKPIDKFGNEIIPDTGDDVAICTDRTYSKIFSECFAGTVALIEDDYQGLTESKQKFEVVYNKTVQQRNFATEVITLEIMAATPLNDILALIFEKAREEVGGALSNGEIIPKFTNYSANIDVAPFSLSGDPLDVLQEVLKSVGYNYQIDYRVEPHTTNTINLIQTYRIFDKNGYGSISPEWNSGITFDTVAQGLMMNPNFETFDDYRIVITESEFKYKKDATVIKNWFNLITKLKDLNNLSRYDEVSPDGIKDTFSFGSSYDVKYVAIPTTSNILTKLSDAEITIELAPSESLIRYQERLVNNGLGTKLVILIKPSATNLDIPIDGIFREIEIDDITNVITLLVETPEVKVNDSVELVHAFDIVAENYDDPGNYDILPSDETGYVIKHISSDPDSLSSVKFTNFDKPNKDQSVLIHYYSVNSNPQVKVFDNKRYGLRVSKQELPYAITTEQLEFIYENYLKFTEPLETITFTSYRPSICQIGWSLPVRIPRTSQNFIVLNVDGEVIGYKDSVYGNLPIIKQQITLGLYSDTLEDIFAMFKNADDVAKSRLKEIKQEIFSHTLQFVQSLNESTILTTLISNPIALDATDISSTSFTLNWTASEGATDYMIEIYTDEALTTTLLGYTALHVGNVTSFIANNFYVESETGPFYYRVKAFKGSGFSDWSNVITATKPIMKYYFISNRTVSGDPTSGYDQIWKCDLDGSNQTKLSSFAVANRVFGLTVNSEKIVYDRYYGTDSPNSVSFADKDFSNIQRIGTPIFGQRLEPTFIVNRNIYYYQYHNISGLSIKKYNIDTAVTTTAVASIPAKPSSLTVSPNERYIAYDDIGIGGQRHYIYDTVTTTLHTSISNASRSGRIVWFPNSDDYIINAYSAGLTYQSSVSNFGTISSALGIPTIDQIYENEGLAAVMGGGGSVGQVKHYDMTTLTLTKTVNVGSMTTIDKVNMA